MRPAVRNFDEHHEVEECLDRIGMPAFGDEHIQNEQFAARAYQAGGIRDDRCRGGHVEIVQNIGIGTHGRTPCRGCRRIPCASRR